MMEHEAFLAIGPLWEGQEFSGPLIRSVSSKDLIAIVQIKQTKNDNNNNKNKAMN